ncbi:hypothetical protein [Mycoplana ramosa]|uniref:ABC transmembrane type-1 domain-containing protein n=1 Tax=Mycoplana ramosa TaxID=40837 RepID=A0ABW3Z0D1_MYCRA
MRLDADDARAVLVLDLDLQHATEIVDGDQGTVEKALQAAVRDLELGLVPIVTVLVGVVGAVIVTVVTVVFGMVAAVAVTVVIALAVVVLIVVVTIIIVSTMITAAAIVAIVIVPVVPAATIAIAIAVVAPPVVVAATIAAIIIIIGKSHRGKRMVRGEREDRRADRPADDAAYADRGNQQSLAKRRMHETVS